MDVVLDSLFLGEVGVEGHELGGDSALADLSHAAQHELIPDLATQEIPVDAIAVQVRDIDLRNKATEQHLPGLDVDLFQHVRQRLVLPVRRSENQTVGRQVRHHRRGKFALLIGLEHG